jgi:hypothetical protein
MTFNPGQHARGGYFVFGLHEPGLTKIFANPGQQFSTRDGSCNIPSNRLEQSILGAYIPYMIVACDFKLCCVIFLYLYLVNGFLISSQGLESGLCREILHTISHFGIITRVKNRT